MNFENVYICVEGKGTPVLLLHGWGVDHMLMKPLFDALKEEYKVCMLDLPGFGKSSIERPFNVTDYVLFIKDVIDTYAMHNPVIIAHSFGCRIAFRYASLFPTRLLLLSGAAGIKPKRTFSYYVKVYMYKCLKKTGLKDYWGSRDYKNADAIMKNTLVKVVNENLEEDIRKIDCPILLVWGEKDEETPLWMAKRIEELNDNTTLIVFEKDDHYAYYHQLPRFLKICKLILKEVE